MTFNHHGRAVALLGVVACLGLSGMAQAQTTPHKGILQRHPTASTAAAGLAAHHIAKHHGPAIVRRHPIATGVAAAAVTHHIAKKK